MVVRTRRLYTRHGEHRKLSSPGDLTPLDYCTMVRNSEMHDAELADLLEVSKNTVRRMRKLDYMPTDKALQERIMRVYLEE